MPTILPTTTVGSYPQPAWLVDHDALRKQGVPRIHAAEIWRVPPEFLEAAQDDATIVAIRDMERAGIDIVTDGEIRRESYSNRFALSLGGIDSEQPGGRAEPVRRHGAGAAHHRSDPSHGTGRTAGHAVSPGQHRPDRQDHAAGSVHHDAAGQERVLRRRRSGRDGLRRRGERGSARPRGGRGGRDPIRRTLDAGPPRSRQAVCRAGHQPCAGGPAGRRP